jgi:predicted transcriptional regulator
MEMLGDLLFELSNDDRRRILLSIREKPKRLTQISQGLGLTIQEVSRQLSRLEKVGLEYKDAKGFHRLTHYGELVLRQLRGFEFTSRFRKYFTTHSLDQLSSEFVDRIGDLSDSKDITNAMDFLRHTENLITEAKEYVWLLVDQFPMNSIKTIVETIDRGVRFRIIEHKERILNPDLYAMTSEETRAVNRTIHTPLVAQRMVNKVDVYLLVSDTCCIIAFPASDGQFDFKGFTATDDISLKCCREIFLHYWDEAERRTTTPVTKVLRGRISRGLEPSNKIVVVGQERPEIDAQAVQDAVDNYDEVTLRGMFNFGASFVQITRSVVVRGEGRENNVPSTTIYKKGWNFPFTKVDSVFKILGEDAEVTIKNIHFTDFNHSCIWVEQGKSISITDNRITLVTGYGRGMTYGAFGDVVIGIWVRDSQTNPFRGTLTVEENYIDFACGGAWGGFLSRGGIEQDPEHRPDLFNHEYYMGFGIAVHRASGDINIIKNIVRNTNARGIATTDNLPSAKVQIFNNTIDSDLYGSYPFAAPEAGAGILAQSAWGFPSPGFNLAIEENIIKLDKLNYSGIKILGPVMDRKGADKLRGGVVRDNRIQLKDGYEGIHVRKCDDFEVIENTISGKVYYGIRISGRRKSGELNLSALHIKVEDNDMRDLDIKGPDEYSDSHVDGGMFAGSPRRSATAHVWLNSYSKENVVKLIKGETMIDEGEKNSISFSKYARDIRS